jgi:hypothetical protein
MQQHTQTHDLTQAAATAGAMQRMQHIHYITLYYQSWDA